MHYVIIKLLDNYAMKSPVFYKFNVNPDNASRIDKIIASELPEYSRSRIQTWIKNGNILF